MVTPASIPGVGAGAQARNEALQAILPGFGVVQKDIYHLATVEAGSQANPATSSIKPLKWGATPAKRPAQVAMSFLRKKAQPVPLWLSRCSCHSLHRPFCSHRLVQSYRSHGSQELGRNLWHPRGSLGLGRTRTSRTPSCFRGLNSLEPQNPSPNISTNKLVVRFGSIFSRCRWLTR